MGERDAPMLFDVVRDPGETTNVIKGNMDAARKLCEKYVELFRTYSRTGEEPPVPAR